MPDVYLPLSQMHPVALRFFAIQSKSKGLVESHFAVPVFAKRRSLIHHELSVHVCAPLITCWRWVSPAT